MSSIESKVAAAAARNEELLSILASTDEAPSALVQQDEYIGALQYELQRANARLAAADAARKKELKEHESYRDSVLKRFAYKAAGKKEAFEARAQKEEREYFEALAAEHREQEIKNNLEAQLADAQRVRAQIQADVARHEDAQHELDALYASIFEGPSGPGLESEDAAEARVRDASAAASAAASHFQAEETALRLLKDANAAMQTAMSSMDDALRASRRDMFGGGTFSDMMERNALARADRAVADARLFVERANRFSPHNVVQSLPPVHVAQGSIVADVLFDNLLTDMAFHNKIKASAAEVARAAEVVAMEVARARQRVVDAKAQWDRAVEELRTRRKELQKVREHAFRRIAANAGVAGVAPPPGPPPAQVA